MSLRELPASPRSFGHLIGSRTTKEAGMIPKRCFNRGAAFQSRNQTTRRRRLRLPYKRSQESENEDALPVSSLAQTQETVPLPVLFQDNTPALSRRQQFPRRTLRGAYDEPAQGQTCFDESSYCGNRLTKATVAARDNSASVDALNLALPMLKKLSEAHTCRR